MVTRWIVVLCVVNVCILPTEGSLWSGSLTNAVERIVSNSLCATLPWYGDLTEVTAMKFFANVTEAIKCSNCELSGSPADVTCTNTNAQSDAVVPAWKCSSVFPHLGYDFDEATVDCDRPRESPSCSDLRTCRLSFSVKRVPGQEFWVCQIIVIAIMIAATIYALSFRQSMRDERLKTLRGGARRRNRRERNRGAEGNVTTSGSRPDSSETVGNREDSPLPSCPPPSYEDAIQMV